MGYSLQPLTHPEAPSPVWSESRTCGRAGWMNAGTRRSEALGLPSALQSAPRSEEAPSRLPGLLWVCKIGLRKNLRFRKKLQSEASASATKVSWNRGPEWSLQPPCMLRPSTHLQLGSTSSAFVRATQPGRHAAHFLKPRRSTGRWARAAEATAWLWWLHSSGTRTVFSLLHP